MNTTPFRYGTERLTVGAALALARGSRPGTIEADAAARIDAGQNAVTAIVDRGDPVYGINTGFGPLCTTRISTEDTRTLQENLLKSHSTGVGDPLPPLVTKLMLILKVHTLALGHSGVTRTTIDRILFHVDHDLIPVVPSQGSVGASGDLAPLAHLLLPLIGLGTVNVKGNTVPAADVLREEGLEPLTLEPKEGLALINGTQFIAAHAALGVARFAHCLDTADIVGAMTLDALLGSTKPFDARLHDLRPHAGSRHVAHRLRALLEGSEINASHAGCGRVQDAYSLRCMPPVHGASRNAWRHLKEQLDIELNAVTDNPIVLDTTTAISGGNFHGQPLALPVDYAALGAHELGNISDRRIFRLLGGTDGVPKLLMTSIGVNSGFMIAQYTAAALVSENKGLCFPASADSIPTALGQEDHVSMGSIGALKLGRILDNLEHVLGIELMCAAQAIDFRRPLKSGAVLDACHEAVRTKLTHATADRVYADDIAIATEIVREGVLVDASEAAAANAGIDLAGPDAGMFTLD